MYRLSIHRYSKLLEIATVVRSKMSSIPLRVREEVWKQNNGSSFDGLCFVCNTHISFVTAQMGHVVSRYRGGPDTVDNLKPICAQCNQNMGTMDLHDYKRKYHKKTYLPSVNLIDMDNDELEMFSSQDHEGEMEKKTKRFVEIVIEKRKIMSDRKKTEEQLEELRIKLQKYEDRIVVLDKELIDLTLVDKCIPNMINMNTIPDDTKMRLESITKNFIDEYTIGSDEGMVEIYELTIIDLFIKYMNKNTGIYGKTKYTIRDIKEQLYPILPEDKRKIYCNKCKLKHSNTSKITMKVEKWRIENLEHEWK